MTRAEARREAKARQKMLRQRQVAADQKRRKAASDARKATKEYRLNVNDEAYIDPTVAVIDATLLSRMYSEPPLNLLERARSLD